MKAPDFFEMKKTNRKISMITCYDYWSAQIVNASTVDCILVGDSVAMVSHGFNSTIPADIELLSLHIKAVQKGAPDKFIIGDMPFMSYRKDLKTNMENVESLIKSGAQAIKLEGAEGNLELIKHISQSGVPVMGHIGLTPQFVHQFGGFKVQGRGEKAAELFKKSAFDLQDAGCFSLVFEAVPSQLAEQVTQQLQIATIGIGAGPNTDGQVLVMQDLLGMNKNFKPKFVKTFLNGYELFLDSFNRFDQQIKDGSFPNIEESYS